MSAKRGRATASRAEKPSARDTSASRRSFLQLLGLGGLGALAASALPVGARRASADTTTPRRLIIIGHCHGWPYDAWKMRPQGKSESQPWTLDLAALPESAFSHALAPLYPHRRRLLALDGLSLVTPELDSDGNRHDRGWVGAWTGNFADFSGAETRARSPSLDQLVAAKIARADRLPSLELSVEDALESGRPIAYGPSGVRLPVQTSPLRAWERVFGPSAAPGGDRLGARRRATLDFAHAEYKKLGPQLDAQGKRRLDAHFALVESLGARLDGLASLSCDRGKTAPAASFARYNARFDAFAEVIGAALACDVTRVVTLTLGEMPTAEFGADAISDKVHKGLAHYIYDDPKKHAAMADYLAMHAAQVARLVSVLENLPDAGGGSVMDNTLIVWGSELADGWHGYSRYNPVLIGGRWAFDTGRYHYWPHETPVQMLLPPSLSTSGRSQKSGLPHQKLLVSVARAMGLEIDHVGLEHVQGQAGDFIDLTGELAGLKG